MLGERAAPGAAPYWRSWWLAGSSTAVTPLPAVAAGILWLYLRQTRAVSLLEQTPEVWVGQTGRSKSGITLIIMTKERFILVMYKL